MDGYVESQHSNLVVKNKYGVGMKMSLVYMELTQIFVGKEKIMYKLRVNRIRIVFFLINLIGIVAFVLSITMDSDRLHKLICASMVVMVTVIADRLWIIWVRWLEVGKCDFIAFQIYVELSKNDKVESKLVLFYAHFILGNYEKCEKIIAELDDAVENMEEYEKNVFQLFKRSYQIFKNGDASTEKDIEELERLIDNSKEEKISLKMAKCSLYCAKKNWNQAIEELKKMKIKTVLEQVVVSFFMGRCYFELKGYEQAYRNLEVARRLGGNTKYVHLAQNLIEQLPDEVKEENIQCKRVPYYYQTLKKLFLGGVIACLVAGIGFVIDNSASRGNSISEIYAKRNFCLENKVDILYQDKIENYEIAIVNQNKKIVYCLFQKDAKKQKDNYRLVYFASIDKYAKSNESFILKLENFSVKPKNENDKTISKQEIEERNKKLIDDVLYGVYWKNKILSSDDITYVGVSYDSTIVNVTLNGQKLDVDTINKKGEEPYYLWKIKNIDLNSYTIVNYEEPVIE